MLGWNLYNNFKEDAAYAVHYLNAWASTNNVRVEPFYIDQYDGEMIP